MSVLLKCFFATAWVASIAIIFHMWMTYEHDPGRVGDPRLTWPEASRLIPDDKNGTLLVFLHPCCPCSRKGMAKLETLLAGQSNPPTAYFLFAPLPGECEPEFDSKIRRIAKSLSSAGTQTDEGGVEARRFGAETSGFIVFYDAEGRLRFRGGITSERGSEQSNSFERLLSEAIQGTRIPLINTPVFGCPLGVGPTY